LYGRRNVVTGTRRERRVFLGSLSMLHVALADGRELLVQEPSAAEGTPAHAAYTRLDHIPPACLKALPE
jgi:hypothetical protein